MTNTGDRVYRSKIVHRQLHGTVAENHWSDPEEAKRFLEAYMRIRWGVEPSEWREAEDQLERWCMRPDGLDGRAVVLDHEVHEDASEKIEAVREMQQEMEAKL